jgi:lincosamide nucleotidyltransferase A/C/D/E
MRAEDVVDLYRELTAAGVDLWIDGGWAVDAVIGRQTRSHNDLDIAVEAKNVEVLRHLLALRGYSQTPSPDASRWNFVVSDDEGRQIDIHVVVLDEELGMLGGALEGIAYPAGALTGWGVLASVSVRCVDANFLLQFKTSYPPRSVDRQDVAALCALLGKAVPATHS